MALNLSSKDFDFPNTVIRQGGAISQYVPWDVIVTPTSGVSYTYKVIPSSVNGVIPTNYLTSGTGALTSPKYINLLVSATQGRVTGVEIQSSETPNTEAPPVLEGVPPSSFIIPIGVIGTDGQFYKFVLPRPFAANPVIFFTTDKAGPVPAGFRTTSSWYSWTVTQPE